MKTRMFKKLGAGLLVILLLVIVSLPTAAASESKGDVVLQDFEAYNSYAEMKAAHKKQDHFYIHSGLYEIDVEGNGNHRLLIDVLGNWDIQFLNYFGQAELEPADRQLQTDFTECNAVAFYVNIPAGCFKTDAVETGRPFFSARYREWSTPFGGERIEGQFKQRLLRLLETDIYYYPVDGEPFIVTNMKGFYPFDQTGAISSDGFEGYILVPFDANMYDELDPEAENAFDPLNSGGMYYFELWGDAGFETEMYVDDITGVKDYANFAPYGKKATKKIQYVKEGGAVQVTTTTAVAATTTVANTDGQTTTVEGVTTTIADGTTTTANSDPADTEPSGNLSWLWIVLAAVVLIGVGLTLFVVVKKSRIRHT